MKKRKIIFLSLAIVFIVVAIIAFCEITVSRNASDKLYDNVDSIPHRKVGLILGTSPISTWNGRRNYYFDHRIKAGADLYKAGKVDWLVVSGGDYRNTGNGYDEPVAMRDSLMKQSVDSTRIILDYDGTRTLNSIAKMRDVYCQDSIILISQKYHNERALYQAKHLGIDAIGFNAKTPGRRTSWWRNRSREVLARVKLFIDVLFGSKPEFQNMGAKNWSFEEVPVAFMDLMYGMSCDNDGHYYDDLLDSIPDIQHYEFKSKWYNDPDKIKFDLTLGIYIDSMFPTKAIQKVIFEKMDSLIIEGMIYDAEPELIRNNVFNTSKQPNVKMYIARWRNIFKNISNEKSGNATKKDYQQIISSRGCTVCHKIFEDDNWITYLLEESIDYHGSCGCPSSADYLTFAKKTSKIFTLTDLLSVNSRSQIENALMTEFSRATHKLGSNPGTYTGEELLNNIDGIAIIKDGLLFYFHPYKVGPGSEGQHNLILRNNYTYEIQ